MSQRNPWRLISVCCALAVALMSGMAAHVWAAEMTDAAIRSANEAFESAFAGGMGGSVAALYTEDATLLPPNSDAVAGRAAIGPFWQAVMDAGIKGVQLETVELTGLEGMAFEVGRYTLTGAAGEELDHGKYVVLWKKGEDGWKLHRDIWNSSVPPAGASEAE